MPLLLVSRRLRTTTSSSIVTATRWYETLSTKDEWEDMQRRVQDILVALQPLDFYTAEEWLALWIEQEEELFWNQSKQPSQYRYYWGEAVAVAAAVASVGVLFLRRS